MLSDSALDKIIERCTAAAVAGDTKPKDFMRAMLREAIALSWAWRPMDYPWSQDNPGTLLGLVGGRVRLIRWGKTSHVPLYGWCLADQGPEDFDLCKPDGWLPLPSAADPLRSGER